MRGSEEGGASGGPPKRLSIGGIILRAFLLGGLVGFLITLVYLFFR